MKKILLAIAITVTAGFQIHAAHAQSDAKRSVTEVAKDVYRFQNNFHYSMVVVTDDGVVVTDPINAEFASWIKEEAGKLTDSR